MTWRLTFLRMSDPKESKVEVFYELASEVTCCHFFSILLVAQASSIQYGRELNQGPSWRLFTTSYNGILFSNEKKLCIHATLQINLRYHNGGKKKQPDRKECLLYPISMVFWDG